MRVATIVPTPYLEEVAQEDYNMCLFQEVVSQPNYAKFFKSQVEEGKFVIMDNGAAEGSNPEAEELLAAYPLVNPSEVVLPDVVGEKDITIEKTRFAYAMFVAAGLEKTTQFMAVPQGADFKEWLECMREFIAQPFITTIGISKFVSKLYAEELGEGTNVRLECVDAVLAAAEKINKDIQIHLLGCYETAVEIGEIAKVFDDEVRGTDSAMAYVLTRNGQQRN